MKTLKIKNLAFYAFAALGLASCGYVEEFDDAVDNSTENGINLSTKKEYEANFTSIFGKLASNQNWDFSSARYAYFNQQGTRAVADISYTKTVGDYYEIQDATLNYFKTELPDGNSDNAKKGGPFTLVANGYDFTIVPMYQDAGWSWDLYMVLTDQNGNSDATSTKEVTTVTTYADEWDEKVYIITNTGRSRNINGTSTSSNSSSAFAIITKDNTKYLFSLSNQAYFKISNGFLTTTTSISDASALDTTNGYLKLGNSYLYMSRNSNYIQIASSTQNTNYYKWTWNSGTNATSSQKTTVNAKRTVSSTTTEKFPDVAGKLIWSKGQNMEVKKSGSSSWTAAGSTSSVDAIRSKQITISGIPAGTIITFYLKVNDSKLNEFSSEGSMIYLSSCPTPTNIPKANINGQQVDKEIMLIGAEDQNHYNNHPNGGGGDQDFNDMCFMIIGEPFLPQPVDIEDDALEYVSKEKRYMAEDLGNTTDFDFNDIVVDIQEVQYTRIERTNGVITKTYDPITIQRAYIRHLGGTLNWEFFVGNQSITGQRYGVMDYDPNELINLKDLGNPWIADENNVSIKIEDSKTSNGYNTTTFPKNGTIPMIIATDTNKQWMNERVTVDWLTGTN